MAMYYKLTEDRIRRIISTALNEMAEAMSRKVQQCALIQKSNPPFNDYSTWIRKPEDILDFSEMMNQAMQDYNEYGDFMYPDLDSDIYNHAAQSGIITIYSSYPIKPGIFVTPSRMCAEEYTGYGKIFSKTVPVDDVAWIDSSQGQYAPVKQTSKAIDEEYNYHVGNISNPNDVKPYRSDNKYRMQGRDTGHFGSGIYFSTYQGKYDHVAPDSEKPNLIQVKDGVYRVDFDLYKNLYRVSSERQGDMLFNTLKNVNHIYYKVEYGNFDCAREYSIISRNSDALGLNCPSYRELLKMARDHVANKSDIRSFSTVFMEYNGFNGVNVSGISKYDNTLHGSVIYDISKVDRDSIRKVNVKYNKIPFMDSSVASDDEMNDVAYDALTDKSFLSLSKLSKLPENEAMRVLKNYPRVPDNLKSMPYYFSDKFIDRYLRILFSKIERGTAKGAEFLALQGENAHFLYDRKAYYYANIMPFYDNSPYGSLLLRFVMDAINNEENPMPTVNAIFSSLKREVTPFEKEIINKWFKANGLPELNLR